MLRFLKTSQARVVDKHGSRSGTMSSKRLLSASSVHGTRPSFVPAVGGGKDPVLLP